MTSGRRSPQEVWAAFRARVAELGGEVLEPDYLGARKPHRVRCAAGHEGAPTPGSVHRGLGVCRTCAGRDPKAAEAAFRARVEELGGVVLEPAWLGSIRPHRVRCAVGHESTPRPNGVRKGGGICRTCVGQDPHAAWVAFRARVEALGGTVLEEKWLGANIPHRVRCAAGHARKSRPAGVQQGGGICIICAKRDSDAAGRAFRERLAELGATLLEPRYLGAHKPHKVRCAAGHECTPHPSTLQQGQGICRTCAGNDSRVAEAAFRARLDELGATLLEDEWLGVRARHKVVCAAGHECAPYPSLVRQGSGICTICTGRAPEVVWPAFRARVEELGGTVLETEWLGAMTPHRIRCPKGHEVTPRPASVQQGGGICRHCKGMAWDAFYVVADDTEDVVKFGITSGDPRPRLRRHEADGFDRVVRLLVDLPANVAPTLERAVLATLQDAREQPVRGREYFPARTLGLVLDVVDNYPTTSPVAPVTAAETPVEPVDTEPLQLTLDGITDAA